MIFHCIPLVSKLSYLDTRLFFAAGTVSRLLLYLASRNRRKLDVVLELTSCAHLAMSYTVSIHSSKTATHCASN